MKLPFYKYLYAAFDLGIILISLFLTAFFVNKADSGNLFSFVEYTVIESFPLIIYFLLLGIVFVFIFQSNNLYKLHLCLSISNQVVAITKSVFYGIIVVIVFSHVFKLLVILESRQFTIVFAFITLISILFYRVIILRFIIRKMFADNVIKTNIIIAGAGGAGRFLATKLHLENEIGIKILGFVDDVKPVGKEILPGLKILGNIQSLETLREKLKINEVIVAIDNISYEKLLNILDYCNELSINVKLISELFEIISEKIETEKYSNIPVIEASPRVSNLTNLFFKRIFDFFGALFGLILLSPILILVAIAIKLTSKGPVLFTHDRVGKDGQLFKFYKFRSMTVSEDGDAARKEMMIDFMKNGKTQTGCDTKIINESRVTAIGSIIRKTSIDELPQLINVLKGEMSLVGPRPSLPYEYDNYDNWQKRRVMVLPGCTGLWQISGRSNVTFTESVVLDLYYINNMTPWLDLQIIIKTIPVMLFAKGGK